MDLEITRYKKLVELYPTYQLYSPEKFEIVTKPTNHFDINLTRYLYIKTFNSIPPDDIWSFGKLLGFSSEIKKVEENTHNLEIKIGILKNEKLQINIINLQVRSSDLFEIVINQLNSKGLSCKLFVTPFSSVSPTEKIGCTKTIYGVCL